MTKKISSALALLLCMAFTAGVSAQPAEKHRCGKCAQEGKKFDHKRGGHKDMKGKDGSRFADMFKAKKEAIDAEVKKTDASFAKELETLAQDGKNKRLTGKVYMILAKAVDFKDMPMPQAKKDKMKADRKYSKGPGMKKGGRDHDKKNCPEGKDCDMRGPKGPQGMMHPGMMGPEKFHMMREEIEKPTMKEAIKEAKLEIATSNNLRKYKEASTDKEKEAVLKDLKQNLADKFDYATQAENKKLEAAEKRLKALKEDSKKRKGDKNKVVEERLKALTEGKKTDAN